jgi:hypothetical protein
MAAVPEAAEKHAIERHKEKGIRYKKPAFRHLSQP